MSSGTWWGFALRLPGRRCWIRTSKAPPGKEFDEMDGYLRKAMERDKRRDQHGNLYLPNMMGSDGK